MLIKSLCKKARVCLVPFYIMVFFKDIALKSRAQAVISVGLAQQYLYFFFFATRNAAVTTVANISATTIENQMPSRSKKMGSIITASDWNAASAGHYSDIVTFTVSYEDK